MIVLGQIVEIVDLSFDVKKNRLIAIMNNGDKAEIDPLEIMKAMPIKDAKERVKDLEMMIHYIDKEQITKLAYILSNVVILNKGIQNARKELKDCDGMTCVKQWQAISKTFVDEKNNLKEIRLAIKEFNKKKMEIRAIIANIEFHEMGGSK